MTNSEINSILIIRLSAIGDVVMASPVIRALRKSYPDAHIAWLVQPEARELLEANPALDEVIVWPRSDWHRLWAQYRWLELARAACTLIGRLRRPRFELAIDLQGLLKSAIWARLSGARTRIGLDSKEGSHWFMTRVIDSPKGDKRIGSEYRYLLQSLGCADTVFRLDIATDAADDAFVAELLQRRGLAQRYAVLCPFTTRPQKHWSDACWVELGERVYVELGLTVVVLGAPDDAQAAERLRSSGNELFNLAGATTLRQAAAVIRGCALLIGLDTGLTHMGTAFNVPTIALFGSTRPYLQTSSERTAVLYKDLECSPCRHHPTCGGAYTCMKLITVDEVMAVAHKLLG